MGFRTDTLKPRYRLLFWIALFAILLLATRRLTALPTEPARRSASPVVINEFVAVNDGSFLDEDGDPSDWIELINRSMDEVDLVDWTLTDDPALPQKWRFEPTELAPGEHLIVYASGKDRRRVTTDDDDKPGYLHTNFRLGATSGFLALYPPTARRYLDGSAIDYPLQESGISAGRIGGSRNGKSGYGYFDTPTPGEANPATPDWLGLTAPVTFSQPHGLYDEDFVLALSSDTSGAEIRYTLDGSEPSASHGEVYREPHDVAGSTIVRAIAVKPDYRSAPATTSSYIFIEDVLAQPNNPAGFPDTWGTHKIDMADYVAGEPVAADYAMDPAIVDDPDYGPQMAEALAALPVLSLVTEVANLDIYADPQTRGREAERRVSVEFFDALGNEAGFQVDAGLRIQGGAGRWEFMPKHSFRLFFRDEYGPPVLSYPLFSDSPVQEFDTLVLRAGVDRSFAGHPSLPNAEVDHRQATYARDEWTRASQIAMSGAGSHGRFVHLFINGLYWGLYNLVERPDAAFMASYYGGNEEDYASINHAGSVSGLIDRFAVPIDLAEAGGLADPEKYATMLEFIDPVQFSDYMILNWYVGNHDWPENNWYVGVNYPAGRNLFFVWDAETTLEDGAEIVLGSDGLEGAPFPSVIKLLFENLMENPDFRMLFADRLFQHTRDAGALGDVAAQQRWIDITEPLESAIITESARWGDVRYDDPITQADWLAASDDVQQQMVDNGEKLRRLARSAGYYPDIDPPRFSQKDAIFDEELTVEMVFDTGQIYYTIDGSDPRLPTSGEISPNAVRYEGPLHLTTAAPIKARLFEEGLWSALNEATYHRADQAGDVRITEVMYNPRGDERDEYVELANLGEIDVSLSGAYFDGIDFRFPRYTTIAPGQVMVVVADFKRFRERYAEVDIHGIFEGKLSDRGETITLYDMNGHVLDSVAYQDGGGWPLSADGTGDSLELARPEGDPNQPHSWRASEEMDGTPGSLGESVGQ